MIIKNLANILTLSRSAGTVVLLFTPFLTKKFFIVYIISGVTDVLDGWVARITHTTSKLGSKLDSISDLFFYTVMMHKIMPYLKRYLPDYIWAGIYITLLIRIVLYVCYALFNKKFMSNHTILNKITGLLLFILPFFVPTNYFVAYSHVVCAIAFIAAIYEVFLVLKRRQQI